MRQERKMARQKWSEIGDRGGGMETRGGRRQASRSWSSRASWSRGFEEVQFSLPSQAHGPQKHSTAQPLYLLPVWLCAPLLKGPGTTHSTFLSEIF